VPIIDAGIAVQPGYSGYDTGMAGDVFIKGVDGSPYMGQVGGRSPSVCFGLGDHGWFVGDTIYPAL